MPLRYSALYDAARIAAKSRFASLPTVTFRRDTPVFRNVGASFDDGLAGAHKARTIFKSEANAWNRWTGRTTQSSKAERDGVGGLYTTLDIDALIGEMFHYTLDTSVEEDMRRKATPPAQHRPNEKPLTPTKLAKGLETRRIFSYTLATDVVAGDLALGSGRGKRFLEDVWSADVVQDAARGTPYRTMLGACWASHDHSFARGVCQGLWDADDQLKAVKVTSVRTEYETTLFQSGENVVLLGRNDDEIRTLLPEREIRFVRTRGRVEQVTTWLKSAGAPGARAWP
jgi:hypothetical protein